MKKETQDPHTTQHRTKHSKAEVAALVAKIKLEEEAQQAELVNRIRARMKRGE